MKTLRTICEIGPTPDAAAGAGRIDRVVQQLTGKSRADVRGLFDHGCVRLNGAAETVPNAAVKTGDAIEVTYDPHRRYRELPKIAPDPAYEILFEDEHLLVVNKAAHVLTVPTASGKGKTLIDALERHINRGRPPKLRRRLHMVQRLDQGVSGVLVVAKTQGIASKLQDQFSAHKPQRNYIAVVAGAMERRRGTFRSYLVTDPDLNRRSTRRPGKGELAITHFEVISSAGDTSVVRVQLETGRRNQIRVHFAEAGHPVLGDPRYGADQSHDRRWKARRLALHAQSLEFEHPATGKTMRFETELPVEFARFVAPRHSRAGKNPARRAPSD